MVFAPGVGDAEAEIEVREGHGGEVLGREAEFTEGHFEGFEGVFLTLPRACNPIVASQAVNLDLLARV